MSDLNIRDLYLAPPEAGIQGMHRIRLGAHRARQQGVRLH